jgi:HlyD family secretion protein
MDEETRHNDILDRLPDGVLALDAGGRITFVNTSAARLLGIPAQTLVGEPYDQALPARLHGDGLALYLKDCLKGATEGGNETVEYIRPDKDPVSFLFTPAPLGDGGVVLCFKNVSKENATREILVKSEATLESKVKNLSTEIHKGHRVRWAVTAGLILVIFALGMYHWKYKMVVHTLDEIEGAHSTQASSKRQTYRVVEHPLSSSIPMSGLIESHDQISIVSPFEGSIRAKHFFYGQKVKKGDVLLVLDTLEIGTQKRDAEVTFIKARENYDQVKNWKTGHQVNGAKESVIRAKRSLDSSKHNFDETSMLFKDGIVSKDSYDAAEQQYANAVLSLKSAREDMASVLQQGSVENVKVAALGMENAEQKLKDLENKIAGSKVLAPVDGIVIRPAQPQNQDGGAPANLQVGGKVTSGQSLAAVSNLESLAVKTTVTETGVNKLKVGQVVSISGQGFPGVALKGKIIHISSQAMPQMGGSGVPTFEVMVALDALPPDARKVIRLGMDANLEVRTFFAPKAITVPIQAVTYDDKGDQVVKVRDAKGGKNILTPVTTGITTVDSVQILSGLKPGDIVVYTASFPSG